MITPTPSHVNELTKMLQAIEPLVPELKRHLETIDMNGNPYQVLRHPLVYSVPYFGKPENARLNATLKHKREAIAEYKAERNWTQVLYMHERPYRRWAFEGIEHLMTNREYWELLGDIWVDTEFPLVKDWLPLFESDRKQRHFIMDVKERKTLKSLPAIIDVYHGEELPGKIGMSWTTDLAVARRFAKRFGKSGQSIPVYQGSVEKRHVLDYFGRRSEFEVLTNPEHVAASVLETIKL